MLPGILPSFLLLLCALAAAGSEESPPPAERLTIALPGLPENARPLEMKLVRAGTFTMGAPAGERGRHAWEWPPHRVTITRDFYLSVHETTQAQWVALMGANPSKGFGTGSDYPVYYVSWEDCQRFIGTLNETGQGRFRLPTEAEWEYACRAGTTSRFSFGDALDCGDVCAPCDTMEKYMWWCGNNRPNGAKETGLKLPNPWGFHDMHGNMYEWCADWWGDPRDRGAVTDPTGPPDGKHRVLRGGGWSYDAVGCRSAFRYGYLPDDRPSYGGFGFRPAMDAP